MYHAMIVDDYEVYRKEIWSMRFWGEASGFVVSDEAANGREALEKLRQRPVDLLVTDIRMPLINGLELLKKVSEEKLCPCVILMSQFSDFEYARQGLSNGAFEYLLKPVDAGELQKVLVRAAAYLDEKMAQLSKIDYLDSILNKSSDEFFPEEEFNNLQNNISEGNPDALESAAYLVNTAYAELDFDLVKTSRLLSRAVKKLVEALPSDFPWLSKFVNLQDYKASDFSQFQDIAQMKQAFVNKIESILSVIGKYELGIDSSNMVRMACKTILENIDSDITINEISNRLFITRTYLSQIFKEKTGMNLVKYLTDVKIERAKVLISSGSKNNEIAEKLGYKDDEYFKKLFKKATGMTINEFKNVASAG